MNYYLVDSFVKKTSAAVVAAAVVVIARRPARVHRTIKQVSLGRRWYGRGSSELYFLSGAVAVRRFGAFRQCFADDLAALRARCPPIVTPRSALTLGTGACAWAYAIPTPRRARRVSPVIVVLIICSSIVRHVPPPPLSSRTYDLNISYYCYCYCWHRRNFRQPIPRLISPPHEILK